VSETYFIVVLIVRPLGDSHQLLMGCRASGEYMGGTWQLISGGIEPDETAWQAAIREMHEETGLSPREFYRLSTLTRFYRSDNDSLNTAPMFCAMVEADAVVQLNSEHTAFDWVNIDQAESRLMWPSDCEAFREVRSVLLEGGLAKQSMRIPL
jgi:dATP pyrophosphohydrolase